MKKLSVLFCAICVGMMTCFPVFADVIGPGSLMPISSYSPSAVWGIIVSSVMAVLALIWHWLTGRK